MRWLVVLLLISFSVFAQEAKKEKTFTQKEVDEIVKKETDRILVKIGKEGVVEFTNELLKKEKELKVKESDLKIKEEQIELGMGDFQKRVKEFQEKQKRLLACIDEVEEQQTKRIQHMVDTISGMRPQAASQVLSVQDPEIAVKILGMLDSEKTSKIFNFMDKEISARLQKQYMTMKK